MMLGDEVKLLPAQTAAGLHAEAGLRVRGPLLHVRLRVAARVLAHDLAGELRPRARVGFRQLHHLDAHTDVPSKKSPSR